MNMTVEEIREARRRKILENSESRLNKILNRSTELEKNLEDTKVTKPLKTAHPVNNDSGLPRCSPSSSDEDFLGLKDETFEPSFNTFQDVKTSNSFNYLRKYFVGLAVLVYFVIARGGSKFPSKSIFTPFATLAIVKQSLVYRHTEPTSSIYLQLLILYGVNASLVLKLSRILNILYDFFLDFCVYFFAFVFLHFIFENLTLSR